MTENKQNINPEELEQDAVEAEAAAGQPEAEEQVQQDAQSEEAAQEGAEETEPTEEKSEEEKEAEAAAAESERFMRLMAEFQNFKKRTDREKSDIRTYANEKIMSDLLPILDNFERALEADVEKDPAAYAQGVMLIFQQMKTALENSGLKELEALGNDFDPAKHNAVMMEPAGEYEAGKVSKVLQKGYTLNDRVVRPAMVAVTQ